MEKYRRFTDESVGVNPFAQQPPKSGLVSRVLGLLLVLLRLPVLAVLYPLLVLVNGTATLLPVPALGRVLRLLLERPFARAVLFFMGFYRIRSESPHPKSAALRGLKSTRPASAPDAAAVASVSRKDILLCNMSSYLDILCLSALYAPEFTSVSRGGGLARISLRSALTRATQPAPAAPADLPAPRTAAETLRAAVSSGTGPLAVFLEGAPTNGRAVLEFTPAATEVEEAVKAMARDGKGAAAAAPRCAVVALRYGEVKASSGGEGGTSGAFSPCYVAGGALSHFFRLLSRPSNGVTVLRLPGGFDPQPQNQTQKQAAQPAGAGSADGSSEAAVPWGSAVREALARLLDVKAVRVNASAHADFFELRRQEESGAGAESDGARGKKAA
jgi:hypothetical protein